VDSGQWTVDGMHEWQLLRYDGRADRRGRWHGMAGYKGSVSRRVSRHTDKHVCTIGHIVLCVVALLWTRRCGRGADTPRPTGGQNRASQRSAANPTGANIGSTSFCMRQVPMKRSSALWKAPCLSLQATRP
jgi:hypothetical protein